MATDRTRQGLLVTNRCPTALQATLGITHAQTGYFVHLIPEAGREGAVVCRVHEGMLYVYNKGLRGEIGVPLAILNELGGE